MAIDETVYQSLINDLINELTVPKITQTDKSELESPGKCSEKVYSHLKHSVNIPHWTVTLTFTPQKRGVNNMCPKSVLFTPP